MGGGRAVAEVKGKIKRANDEGGTAWAEADSAGLGTIVGTFFAEKAFGVTNSEIDFGDEGSGFGAGFDNRFTDFATDALGQFLLVGVEDFLCGSKKFDSFGQGGGSPAWGGGGGGGENGPAMGGRDFWEEIGKVSWVGVLPRGGIRSHGLRGRHERCRGEH